MYTPSKTQKHKNDSINLYNVTYKQVGSCRCSFTKYETGCTSTTHIIWWKPETEVFIFPEWMVLLLKTRIFLINKGGMHQGSGGEGRLFLAANIIFKFTYKKK